MNETQRQSVAPKDKSNTSVGSHVSAEDEIQFFAIKFIAKSRLAKIVFRSVSVIVAVFLLGKFCLSIYSIFQNPPPRNPSICVFLPDSAHASDGAFYQDGVVQRKGVDSALIDAEQLPNRLDVVFCNMKRDDTPNQLLNEMKERYAKEGATYFIVTMSGKILGLREHFKKWHKECVDQGKRAPILIATVASAPNIADANSGIVRWYVRSEEESSILATYLRWKMSIHRAGVFFINDDYGKRGMEVFRDRFLFSLRGLSVDTFPVTATSAKTEVQAFLAKYRNGTGQSNEHTGVFVVGYGDMVRETLNELVEQGFDGPIACASTLTEPDWQPKNTIADNRIVTVLPRLSDPQAKLRGDDRNIVFLFAKKTLCRVLELTADNSDSRTFIDRWKLDSTKSGIDQECLANGDMIVQLDVVGSEQWR